MRGSEIVCESTFNVCTLFVLLLMSSLVVFEGWRLGEREGNGW